MVAPSSGNALDWVYGRLNIVHSYGAELRPESNVWYNGFVMEGSEIVPSGEDVLVGLSSISKFIVKENEYSKYPRL